MMRFMQATGRTVRLAIVAVALGLSSLAAHAQQPSAAALASANELIKVTSATTLFNPLIAGVVEQAKNLYVQQNPALTNDVNEIANKMRTDLAPRFSELTNEVARLYAARFTEQ